MPAGPTGLAGRRIWRRGSGWGRAGGAAGQRGWPAERARPAAPRCVIAIAAFAALAALLRHRAEQPVRPERQELSERRQSSAAQGQRPASPCGRTVVVGHAAWRVSMNHACAARPTRHRRVVLAPGSACGGSHGQACTSNHKRRKRSGPRPARTRGEPSREPVVTSPPATEPASASASFGPPSPHRRGPAAP